MNEGTKGIDFREAVHKTRSLEYMNVNLVGCKTHSSKNKNY
jgi:hypothetical protein